MSRSLYRNSSRLSLDLSEKAPKLFRQQSMVALSGNSCCKIVVVGDSRCGKSTLIASFLEDGKFSERYIPTTFETYTHNLEQDLFSMQLSIWDTSGKSEYDLMRPLSYKNLNAVIICFDVSIPESLEHAIYKWHPEISKHCPHCPVILAGCKTDLREHQKDRLHSDGDSTDNGSRLGEVPVTHDQGTSAATQISAEAYVECSSKANSPSVREVFEVAALASVGQLGLQKSYIDLPSTVPRRSLSTSLRTRMKRTQSVNGSVRVRATMVESASKGCAIM